MLVPCPQLPLGHPLWRTFGGDRMGSPSRLKYGWTLWKWNHQPVKIVKENGWCWNIPWNRILKKQHERIIRYHGAGLWRNIDDFSMTILAYFHGVGAYSWMNIVVFWGGSLTWKENEHVSSLQMSPVSPWIYHPNWCFLGKRRALTLVRDQITCDHEWSMSWPTLQNLVLGPLPCTRA